MTTEADGWLLLLQSAGLVTIGATVMYVIVRLRAVPRSPPKPFSGTTQSDVGVKRVNRDDYKRNLSAERRDYLVRRYFPTRMILPGALLTVLFGVLYLWSR